MKHCRIAVKLFSVVLLLCAFQVHAQNKVQADVISNIKKSQSEINTLQDSYAKKLSTLTKRVNGKSAKVAALRKQVAAARRSTDEQSLSIDALRSRVKKWDNQHAYQQHLVLSYLGQNRHLLQENADHTDISTSGIDPSKNALSENLTIFETSLDDVRGKLIPTWEVQNIVDHHGSILSLPILNLGPTHWYIDQSNNQAGLLKRDFKNNLVMSIEFTGSNISELSKIYKEGKGEIAFDPTLDKVGQYLQDKESVVEHVEKGGIWIFPILFFALLSVIIAIIKSVELYRLPKIIPMVPERVAKALSLNKQEKLAEIQKIYKGTQGAQRELVKIALETKSTPERDDLLVSSLLENKHKLERFLGIVAITAAVAPLLGLLGTVSGMIETFRMMTIFGTGDPAVVSGGISEALVTTELGLVVAIPALVINAILLRRIKSYTHLLETMAIKLSKIELSHQDKAE